MMLVNYGIQNEISDLRAHVSVCNASVYSFTPDVALRAIQAHPEIEPRKAYQNGVNFPTANGYPVPVKYIHGIRITEIPKDIFIQANFLQGDDTSTKGRKAVFVIKEMLKINLIPLTFKIDEVTDRTMQIQGTDILVSAKYRIQVKCDWRIGETGNIYLQTQERNPLKRI